MSDLAAHFEDLWESTDSPPDVFAFLEQHASHDAAEKLAVVLRDQKYRWRTDRPLTVEQYLAKFPEIGANPVWKCDLVLGELQKRESGGTPLAIDELVARFPDISDQIRSKLSDEVTDYQGDTGVNLTESSTGKAGKTAESYGRYRVVRVLGEGGFGRVYLGADQELHRQVAIKIPTPERLRRQQDAVAYLTEARVVASLDHPNIVPVHDVGRTDDGMIYVVSKYINGCTFRDCIREKSLSHAEAATLLATIAQALDHSHTRRLIHRDIKPGNILIEDESSTAYLADFGLAMREEDYLKTTRVAGTPSYMSPEQARGEGHRLDGRSDIFSLGVVLYEALTGKRPFRGSTANEMRHQIISVDPPSPRDYDVSIPVELERICFKALAKQRSDRYATAAEMADDLLHWQQQPQAEQHDKPMVPRGIRSFGPDDADFFLDLLPGPRNRDGLPDSIQFWKTRIEETDPDLTFSVGLIYGPSGCGKSSLVKAGLLPRLSKQVLAIYVEAGPTDTETRIRRRISKYFPEVKSREKKLVELFTHLRKNSDRKVLLVLDQFEQWLHAHPSESSAELIDALRQCDGEHVQAVVMVRDDFAMAAARFMDAIDVPITQGHNFATIDLFDEDHAFKLLHRFGQAFGKFPAKQDELSEDERQFLTSAASGLASDGKVVSVQLALFAEMIKGRPWVTSTLREVGGTKGVGANFLEETFSSRSANPKHFQHAVASRKVLKALLPELGSDIKGHMRSHAELMQIAEYENRPAEFSELLRILDGELRLITPTDPEGQRSESENSQFTKHYQLTHDYLVPSLREWLTRKQAESRRGRAALRLDACSSFWSRDQQARFLPNLWEYANIQLFVRRRQLSDTQRRMMGHATRYYASRSGLLLAAVLLMLWIGQRWLRSQNTATVVQSLATAETIDVPDIIAEIEPRRHWANPRLADILAQADPSSKEHLHASLALLPSDPTQLESLHQRLLDADLREFPVIRDALAGHSKKIIAGLWKVLEDAQAEEDRRLRAAMALAIYDPPHGVDDETRWKAVAPFLVDHMIESALKNPSHYDLLTESMQPSAEALKFPLKAIYRSPSDTPRRAMGTAMLINYASDSPTDLAKMFLDSHPEQIPNLIPLLDRHRFSMIRLMENRVRAVVEGETDNPTPMDAEDARRIAHAAALLTRYEKTNDVWQLLRFPKYPVVRSYFIHRLKPVGVSSEIIFAQLEKAEDASSRRALLQALGELDYAKLSTEQYDRTIASVRDIYFDDPDSGVHGSAEWLLRKWHALDQRIQNELRDASSNRKTEANWRVIDQGQTMVVVDARVVPTVGRKFEIASTETRIEQFRRFYPNYRTSAPNEDGCPAGSLTWFEAVRYCRWLSEQEEIPEDQMCYPPFESDDESDEVVEPYPDYLQRRGYRLATAKEWIYASLHETSRQLYSAEISELLEKYAWTENRTPHLMPTGLLKPNGIGLFDMCSNIREWCADDIPKFRYAHGGTFSSPQKDWDKPQQFAPITHFRSIGFRVARTLETGEPFDGEPDLSELTTDSVQWAMQACDLLGERIFRELFVEGAEADEWIVRGRHRYPCSAILVAACSHQWGATVDSLKNVLTDSQSSSDWGKKLGFQVVVQ